MANNRQRHFRITIALDLSYPREENFLLNMLSGFGNAECRFVPIDPSIVLNLPVRQHFTAAMYIRLFAGSLLPAEADRVLYLDCDMVICGDLEPLWQTPLSDNLLAAVPDMFMATPDYVNSGVLLLNLRQWREENIGEKCLRYIEEHAGRLLYPDQDAINAVCAGRIVALPLYWNWQARMAETNPARLQLSRTEFLRLRRKPGIVHYTTGSKPWMYRKQVPYTGLYYRYLALTPWRDYSAPDRILRRRFSKPVRMLKQFFRWMRASWRN